MNKYVESQSKSAVAIGNDDLLCRHCIYRDDSMQTAFCVAFPPSKGRKPTSVLIGKGCSEYVKERADDS